MLICVKLDYFWKHNELLTLPIYFNILTIILIIFLIIPATPTALLVLSILSMHQIK